MGSRDIDRCLAGRRKSKLDSTCTVRGSSSARGAAAGAPPARPGESASRTFVASCMAGLHVSMSALWLPRRCRAHILPIEFGICAPAVTVNAGNVLPFVTVVLFGLTVYVPSAGGSSVPMQCSVFTSGTRAPIPFHVPLRVGVSLTQQLFLWH